MLIVPITATPSQTVTCVLGEQNCTITIYQKNSSVYLDLMVDNVIIGSTMMALNNVKIVRYGYLGFIGDLMFSDVIGTSDPDYTGFNTRYMLVYLEASDLV